MARAIRVPVGLGADPHILFLAALRQRGIDQPVPEFSFALHEQPPRKFRWDYAWPIQMVALEVQGAIWVKGSHGRGTGITRDHVKFNLGAALGWRLLQCVPKDLYKPETLDLIHRTLNS